MMEDNKPVKQFSRVLIILALVAICVIGYFLLHQKKLDTKSYNLGSFSTFKLAGNDLGTGVSFQKPKEFQQTANTLNLKTEAQFSDSGKIPVKDGIKLVNLASTSVVTSENPVDSTYIDSLKKILKNPNTNEYKQYVKPLFDFVKLRSLKTTDIKFENAKALTQPNFSNKTGTLAAWQFNFSGTDKSHSGYMLKGNYIVIASPRGFYYFFVMAKDSSWDDNQTAWTKIINSIKVDQ